jgi:2-methylisocitrate lyase-like PEP mutase family enzyme
MERIMAQHWSTLLKGAGPLLLPVAHDALTARLIARAGFKAYQVGGFALTASRHALPDIGLVGFDGEYPAVADILHASPLPLMVDCDDGGAGPRSVARVVRRYESMGVAAIFFEDQASPKQCGHMAKKVCIPPEAYLAKLAAALDERRSPHFFVMARTDAAAGEGLASAIDRALRYREGGADAIFVDGLSSEEELAEFGTALAGGSLATTIMEGGGKTPVLPPRRMRELGYSMVLYPTSVLFRVAAAIEDALAGLLSPRGEGATDSVTFAEFEDMMEMPRWEKIGNDAREA